MSTALTIKKADICFFAPTGYGNELFNLSDENYVSYNRDCAASRYSGLDLLLSAMTGKHVESGEETALHYDDEWFILNGDHRKKIITAYSRSGKIGVLKYFEKHLVQHPWSSGEKQDLSELISTAK